MRVCDQVTQLASRRAERARLHSSRVHAETVTTARGPDRGVKPEPRSHEVEREERTVYKLEILEKFDFYRSASRALQEELREAARSVDLSPGSFYFRAGDACTQIALVGEGNVRVFQIGSSGREVTLYHVQEGETCLLTLNSALTGELYPADAVIESEVAAVLLPVAPFRAWVDRHAGMRSFVFSVMARRITDLMALVHEIALRRVDRRLACFLLDQFERQPAGNSCLSTTHEHVAVELSTAREVVSRLLKELEHEGALELGRGWIRLRNPGALRELSLRD